jgi:hypothetical protein
LHRDDRAPEPGWLEEPSTEPRIDHRHRYRAAMPTLLLVAAVILIVALIFLL